MRYLLILVLAGCALGCSGGSKQDQLSDQEIRDAQKRVKDLESKSELPK